MPLNDALTEPSLRQPRGQVLINGKAVPGLLSLEVTNNNYYQADRYRAQFALFADPAFGPGWWGTQEKPLLDFQAKATNDDSFTSLLIGEIDRMDMQLGHGIVSIQGRDLTSRLIDRKTQETFRNKTSSQIVAELAGRVGLDVDSDSTDEKVGRYWSEDRDHIVADQFSHARSYWDMIVFLAQHEQFDAWVTGTTLHFKKRVQNDPNPYLLRYVPPSADSPVASANAVEIHLDRSLTLAADVIVAVHSYRPRDARGFTIYEPFDAKGAAAAGKAQVFTFHLPNATEDDARRFAVQMREDITRHEKLLRFRRPADMTLTARNMVQLKGVGEGWDQTYYVDSITRRLSMHDAFTMEVSCKNHSPQSEVQIG